MIRVLFIALEFPPLNNTGVHRSAKWAKYWRESGVEPIVVTIDPVDASKSFAAPIEPALLAELPSDLTVYALPCPLEQTENMPRLASFLYYWLRLEDSLSKRFRPALLRALPGILAHHRPQVVCVSLPPFSAGLLALEISREAKIPLVVDMRDGWSHWCMGPFPTFAHWVLVLLRERKVFTGASAVVTVTSQLANIFRRSHPDIPHSRFHVVPNGYDGILNLPDMLEVPLRAQDAVTTIGYVGRFYYSPEARAGLLTPWWKRRAHRKLHYQPAREDWLYRSPYFFFRALAELRRRDPDLGRRIRFSLIGERPPWWNAMVAEHELTDVVYCHGHVEQARVHELSSTFDALLCTSVKVEGGEDYALASKTFDYVRAGRPILGLVTRGSQREFLEQSGLALLADPDDLEAGVLALSQLARGGLTLRPNLAFLATYDRRALAKRMALIIQRALETQPKSTAVASGVQGQVPAGCNRGHMS